MPQLHPIVDTVPDRCVSCHRCISVCPVKFANDASGDTVKVIHDRCIGCGQCLKACTHKARIGLDDANAFWADLGRRVKTVAIVAPAVAAQFPDRYLRLNGWLASLGVEAVFDVSFGAELTVKSYLEHLKRDRPACVVSQPCPAIVSYCQIYRPELLPRLAPADSPMLHAIRMIRRYHPEYRGHRVAVLSPCWAKRREFDETGHGDYNVTLASVQKHLDRNRVDLGSFPERDYDNPPAERAVLFSTPGGLLRTAERHVPGIGKDIRKIEGPEVVYHYLDSLPEMIRQGLAPLLVDCLNCEAGCNGGTAVPNAGQPLDLLEAAVENRARQARARYDGAAASRWRSRRSAEKRGRRLLDRRIEARWEPGLYARSYRNHSANGRIPVPGADERRRVMASMGKNGDRDLYDCAACGYNTCDRMVQAVAAGLNRPENCYHFLLGQAERDKKNIGQIHGMTLGVARTLADNARSMADMTGAMEEIGGFSSRIGSVVKTIEEVAFQTNLLALNAAVEAARAGESGKGFAVVADEVRNLAQRSGQSARDTRTMIEETLSSVQKGVAAARAMQDSLKALRETSQRLDEVATRMETEHETNRARS